MPISSTILARYHHGQWTAAKSRHSERTWAMTRVTVFNACSRSAPHVTARAAARCPQVVAGLAALVVLGAGAPASGAPTLPSVFEPGMDASLFDVDAYAGRWYEIASRKDGFAGAGQEDCHCTQGVYKRTGDNQLEVSTFCFHGSPTGRLSGIVGRVSCANPAVLKLLPEFESDLERQLMIRIKCVLRFPAIPIVPPEPYNVIKSDYQSYALVQGAKDLTFVQVYARESNPGPAFLQARLEELRELGYDVSKVAPTPQDCGAVTDDQLGRMMASRAVVNVGMERDGLVSKSMLQLPEEGSVRLEDTPGPEGDNAITLNYYVNPLQVLKGFVKLLSSR